jgi:hypothetical protein
MKKIDVPVNAREVGCGDMFYVTVGTTGPKGGDSGHGGRTILKLDAGTSCDFRMRLNDEDPWIHGDGISLLVGGDMEMDAFLEALRFAVRELERKGPHRFVAVE